MKNKETYKNKVQNMFTAYLARSIEGKRLNYLNKKNRWEMHEFYLEDSIGTESAAYFDELFESYEKETILEKEAHGDYPEWEALPDDSLIAAIRLLKPEERGLLYAHVFEEKSFEQIAAEQKTAPNKVENRYYYATKKIRKWVKELEGTKDEF
ncbi:hypothetical protein CE91St62_39390 [Lachnospiraceae bacterium]|uniref:sigma-70 family RNA polymerase sigma factor n=1 Tax=Extibacter sp. GGCC_0201 TaxID=2731209 RepID=UPI001AA0CF9C|nr:sigma-70 family RNA polymerase sigma factor [Extibacter sp. GGCC_0201]MBO1720698.1 sigma-70 family RNA polymerase sigma factor [Extibacter sp. GGCC_0201]BDF35877.1 hypothetical protein CE91St61_39520 [Lachnospiraceae bacterium]BDF39878.1 hypothetical protein CE91St62_39390 [Lachnospiraceae bacterium]